MKLKTIFCASLLAVTYLQAQAQTFPDKAIKVIVPFAPGGGIDVLTRAMAVKLSARWGQPIVIENKAGAGSLIGTQLVAQSPADGYTLLATVNQTMVGNRYLYKKLSYDPDKSFDPITMMVQGDQVIVAHTGFPANTLKEAVEFARKNPDAVNYGSFGNGSQPHLLFSLVKDREKVDMTHIPYGGITPNLTALASGEVQLGSGSAAVIAPYLVSGRVKPIAVAGDSAMSQFPGVTTTTQQGLPYAKVSIWYGLFAPAGTPPAVMNQIRTAVQAVLTEPEFAQQQVVSKGLTVVAGDGAQLRSTIAKEAEATAIMIKAAGVVAE